MSGLPVHILSPDPGPSPRRSVQKVLLVEDSRMFASILSHRFRAELNLDIVLCPSMKCLKAMIGAPDHDFTLAVVNLNLPDSVYGEALDVIIGLKVPTIVFTAAVDTDMRSRLMERGIIDYVVKDNALAIDNLVGSVRRAINNSRTRVLVVDAASAARQALVAILEMQQFMVVEAAGGAEAISMLNHHPDIELIIIDQFLSDMDGCELTRQLAHRHKSDRLRVIGLSASNEPLIATLFLKAGAADFLHRPFVAEELQCRITRALETLTQFKQLRAAASVDYLTGLYNRRYFFDQGPRVVNDCLRLKTPSSVGILDIDHFKRLNDTYGHEIGDQVLKAVAGRLQEFFEGSHHLLSRIGGEEFAILFIDMDSLAATSLCDKLRENLTGLKILADDEELSVTVSIGIAAIAGYETFENYLNAADQFLYMAKHKGRNQVYSDARMAVEIAR